VVPWGRSQPPCTPGSRRDRAETRLPLRRAPPLLRPPHRRRTRLRHCQRPRRQRHQPRLVPPHGPGPAGADHDGPAYHPQPADPASLERPATRQPAPRRQRPAPENPPPSANDSQRSPPLPGRHRHPHPAAAANTTPRHGDQDGLPRIPATHSADTPNPRFILVLQSGFVTTGSPFFRPGSGVRFGDRPPEVGGRVRRSSYRHR
jgi:hypothetical protein